MAAADYRLLTEATGQRIAAALEALSGTGAAAAAARTNLDVYSKGETDTAIAQSTAKLAKRTVLFYGALSTTDATYTLSDGADNYLFISVETLWYENQVSDNVVLIPSGAWLTNEYLDIHRHNDSSASYLRINDRRVTNFVAKVTDAGIRVRVCGISAI